MPDDEIPLLKFIVAEPGGYCDPETGLCVTPDPAEGDEVAVLVDRLAAGEFPDA